jgi:L-asparaginase II
VVSTVLVEVRRGSTVEGRHYGALAAASHSGEPTHQLAVRTLLAKLGLDEGALHCGTMPPIDHETAIRVGAGLLAPSSLQCDCSGKHSGMLAVCLQQGWPLDTYEQPDHPLQQEIREIMSIFLGLPAGEIATGTDGCGVPTFAAPLANIARAGATLITPPEPYRAAATRVLDAMGAAPYMVAGRGRLCTDLMNLAAPAVITKVGAEGVFCMALREHGMGVAIKVEDGSMRALPGIAAAVLQQLGVWGDTDVARLLALHTPEIRNHTDTLVGELRPIFTLQ